MHCEEMRLLTLASSHDLRTLRALDDRGDRGPDPARCGSDVVGRLEEPPRRQRRSVSPSPTPRVEAAWTASEDRGAPDRLVAFLTGGDGDTRTGRLCPRCGSSRHGRPFLRRTDVPAAERISIARTTGATLVAVSWTGAVGVDVERLDRFSDPALAGVVLHPEERAATPDRLAATWVRKEALLKMTGDGLVGGTRPDPAGRAADSPGRRPVAVRRGPGLGCRRPAAGTGSGRRVAGEGERPGTVTVSEVAPEAPLGPARRRTAGSAPPRSSAPRTPRAPGC